MAIRAIEAARAAVRLRRLPRPRVTRVGGAMSVNVPTIAALSFPGFDAADKGTVDFQRVHRKLAKMRERRVSGSEVVDADADANRAETRSAGSSRRLDSPSPCSRSTPERGIRGSRPESLTAAETRWMSVGSLSCTPERLTEIHRLVGEKRRPATSSGGRMLHEESTRRAGRSILSSPRLE